MLDSAESIKSDGTDPCPSLSSSSFNNKRELISLQERSLHNSVIIRVVGSGPSGEGSSDDEDEDQEKRSHKKERWQNSTRPDKSTRPRLARYDSKSVIDTISDNPIDWDMTCSCN